MSWFPHKLDTSNSGPFRHQLHRACEQKIILRYIHTKTLHIQKLLLRNESSMKGTEHRKNVTDNIQQFFFRKTRKNSRRTLSLLFQHLSPNSGLFGNRRNPCIHRECESSQQQKEIWKQCLNCRSGHTWAQHEWRSLQRLHYLVAISSPGPNQWHRN